jgi:hypothetical protein
LESRDDMVCGHLTMTWETNSSLLGYRLNKWWYISKGGESAQRWYWCCCLINIEGLILVTSWLMLDSRLTNTKDLALLSIIIIIIMSPCRLCLHSSHTTLALLARVQVPIAEWAHSLHNTKILVRKTSVELKMWWKLI